MRTQRHIGKKTTGKKTTGKKDRGKKFIVRFLCITILFSFFGCSFFGKKKDDNPNTNPGQLADGSYIVGSWAVSYASTSAERNPGSAFTFVYSFDPINSAKVEVRDAHKGGIVCTGYGQYRIVQKDVLIYIQSVSSSVCGFESPMHWGSVQVLSKSLKANDKNGQAMTFFSAKSAESAVVGLWDFKSALSDEAGNGGIDFIFFDHQGYFLIQTTISGAQYLLVGFYEITSESILKLSFFINMDPSQVDGEPLEFSQFVTDGKVLQLVTKDAEGNPLILSGERL